MMVFLYLQVKFAREGLQVAVKKSMGTKRNEWFMVSAYVVYVLCFTKLVILLGARRGFLNTMWNDKYEHCC